MTSAVVPSRAALVHADAALEQHLGHLDVAVAGGEQQRRESSLRGFVDRRAGVDEQPHLRMSFGDRPHQRRLAGDAAPWPSGPRRPRAAHSPLRRGRSAPRSSAASRRSGRGIGLRSGPQQRADDGGVAVAAGERERRDAEGRGHVGVGLGADQRRTRSASSRSTAQCRAVVPSGIFSLTSTCFFSSRRAASSCPRRIASASCGRASAIEGSPNARPIATTPPRCPTDGPLPHSHLFHACHRSGPLRTCTTR